MSVAAIAPPQASPASAAPSRRNSNEARVEPLVFRTSPALFASCSFAAGILVCHTFYLPPPVGLLAALFAGALASLAARHALRLALAPLCLTWIVAGGVCVEIHPAANPQTELLSWASGSAHTLQGEVMRAGPIREVESTAPFASRAISEESQTLDLKVRTIADSPAPAQSIEGGLRLTLYAPAEESFPTINCGDVIQVTVPLRAPERYNDPGVWNSSAYLLGQGIGALASAKTTAVSVVSAPRHPSFSCRLKASQQAAGERIMRLADPGSTEPQHSLWSFFCLTTEDASMLSAMVTGDRAWLQRRTRIGFERTGSFHLLVVSGLHLAIFAGLVFWMAQRIRLPRLWASLTTVCLALAYAVFTGFGQPVQRSFWMVTLYLFARLFWRERAPLNAIGFAALCLLSANPASLFDAGFQMTLLSVIAIAGIAAPVAEGTFAPYLRASRNLSLIAIDPALPPRVAQFRVSLRLLAIHLSPLVGRRLAFNAPAIVVRFSLRVAELLLVSVVVEVAMSLPMALYFHRVTVLALPVNFLIVPFLGFLLPSALLTFAASTISAKLAVLTAAITAALLHSVTALIRLFSGMRAGDFRIPGPSITAIAVFLALLGFAICAARLRRFAVPVCVVALALMATAVVLPRPMQRKAAVLEVTAIDVGQGDSLLVISPDGKTLLIDAGGSPFGPPPGIATFDIGEDVVSAYLWSRGIRRLDAVALTHAHADHIGGMPAVLANFRPQEIWVGNNPHSEAYDAFLSEAKSYGAVIERHSTGDHFQFGSTQVEVLAPDASYRPGPTPANNDSLVLRIQYGQSSALLEGDAEAPSEARMLTEGNLHSDLLKVGHHGSRTSTTPPFLAAVSPSFAVISVGGRNLYGHPRREVLEELQTSHIRTWRTDAVGISTFYLDGGRVTPAPSPAPSN